MTPTQDTCKLENIPQSETNNKWPDLLVEIIDVFAKEFEKQGEDAQKARTQANHFTFTLAEYFGGRSFYLPSGTRLKATVRAYTIFKEFNGNNIKELVKKYHLSESHIYNILRIQRKKQKERNNKKYQ
ncbi:Mor transcription activator family protein [Lonepinella sp. MS14435]|uniref:Mor transcription activator family protein n=1 Tax=Lonepinella sp. MS14435 TaxID=3003618 RepID=UPI0036DF8CCA